MTRQLKQTALAALVTAALFAAPAFAAAPMVKTPAPGYFRMMLGDFEVTAINDGTVDLPVDKLLQGEKPAAITAALTKSFLKVPLETSVNTFLINTGSKLVLVDAGAAGLFGPTLGKFVANLKAAGYQPEQIDEIYITHMHSDHVGGLAANGQRTFPNATVRAQKQEADFWLNPANMDKNPKQADAFKGAMASLNPYVTAGKFSPFEGNVELVPGISSLSGKGHTPGHATYMVESKGQKLVLIGDLIHVGAVQFDRPQVTIAFDSDQKTAAAERRQAFDAAARAGYLVGAAHLQFPGIGHIVKEAKGYDFIPVNYTQMR
ncbi:MBL fold metallo-hydrolase [Massilia eurypsychrophila]|jgi:glyoxylase-like metal-dependent hydrolase (beta-lactamase superfamily II)|uniref:MBL fold metallo-hydrolase n=1 Tax=Massilia eurypsychrophila TaxID=1485217 RepID=A0A2G8TF64_9BURK|nr:MBL fold metallo-hydrolase [Massilia eurypsychrophila]PIL44680.1 MBL fold metallo-hydrolase [Massilia eurypsychrophila]